MIFFFGRVVKFALPGWGRINFFGRLGEWRNLFYRKKILNNNYPLVIYLMRSFKENKYNFCRISKIEQGIDIADKPQVKSHNKVMKSTFLIVT